MKIFKPLSVNKEVQRKQQPLNLLSYFQEIMLVCSSRYLYRKKLFFPCNKRHKVMTIIYMAHTYALKDQINTHVWKVVFQMEEISRDKAIALFFLVWLRYS